MRQEINKPIYVPEDNGSYMIHNVHILDVSGSMTGSKIQSARLGINEEINKLRLSDIKNMTFSLVEFDSRYTSSGLGNPMEELRVTKPYWMSSIKSLKPYVGRNPDGGTPLYQVTGETIEQLLKEVSPNDRVVITIFTDGGENSSKGKYSNASSLKEIMDTVQANNNFTITFMGTEHDVEHMISKMKLSKGNTLSHSNTPESIKTSYLKRSASLMMYSKSVNEGEFATTDTFFKKTESE